MQHLHLIKILLSAKQWTWSYINRKYCNIARKVIYFHVVKWYLPLISVWIYSLLSRFQYLNKINIIITMHISILALLEPKAISLCYQYRVRPTRLYTFDWPTSSSHVDFPKMIMDSSKNGSWIIPFKKIVLRVNALFLTWSKTIYISLYLYAST